MPTTWTRARATVLVVTGMALLLAGVVAGSAVGTLIDPEPDTTPLDLGEANNARGRPTRLTADNDGTAFLVRQRGTGETIRADGINGDGVVAISHSPDGSAMEASQRGASGNGAAIAADGGRNIGVNASSSRSVAVVATSPEVAIYASGQTVVEGDLYVGGTCTGCATAALAVNASDAALLQGQAVTVTGTTLGDTGTLMLLVAPALPGDFIVGIVDTAVAQRTQRVTSDTTVTLYVPSSQTITPDSTLRIVTGGIVQSVRVDPAAVGVAPGDSLVAAAMPGTLVPATADSAPGTSIGFALGPVAGGSVPLFISPH